ncbi:MAG: hypothetical protein DDT30_02178 [Dehalococcoidia bacterium]|nr:hypothetical protein [Bacillota bacterium]
MSIHSIPQKTFLDKPLTQGVSPWLDPSPSAALSRLDAALCLSHLTPISLSGDDPESGTLQKASTPGNVGIGEGGSLNNTDIRGAYTREAPSLELAAPLLFPRQADGLDVWGGGAILDGGHAVSSLAPISLPGGDPEGLGARDYVGQGVDLASSVYYKDHVDTSSEELSGLPWPDCAKWFSIGKCENGHRFAKVHLCGKEWCPTCGAKGSWIHNRRFSRWLVKAQQMEDIGYFVIEWPVASRPGLRSKQALADMGKRVKGAFQALGFDRGLRRWHFFGEHGDKFNPHINVLVESAYLPKQCLEDIKVYLRLVLDEPDLIVNYSYRQSVAEKVHTLKYVTRATFVDLSWDPWIANDLYNFQNSNYWGKWNDDPVWEMNHEQKGVKALESGKCPHCGMLIRWDSKVLEIAWLQSWQAAGVLRPVGGGYFEFADTG